MEAYRSVIEEARQEAMRSLPLPTESGIANFSIGYIASAYHCLVMAVDDLLKNPNSTMHQHIVRNEIAKYRTGKQA